jgi:hypothetical protein
VTEEVAEAKSECYSSIKSKDTVTMDLKIDKDLSVVGNLCYRFFEKDKNDGTVIGNCKAIHLLPITLLCRRSYFHAPSCVCKKKEIRM